MADFHKTNLPAGQAGRRAFIAKTVKGGLAVSVGLTAVAPLLQSHTKIENFIPVNSHTGFEQQPLPYAYNALENVIEAMTMKLHYSTHAAAYSKNLKDAATAEKVDTTKPLEDVLTNISKYSAKMRNNGGGHYNHEMFWQSMRPKRQNPQGSVCNARAGKLLEGIEKQFHSFDNFKKQFAAFGKNRFGSGWAWLYINKENMITIGSTINQDNPLMDLHTGQAGVAEIKGYPILGLNVWEHAYYLKYQNRRADYIDAWWSVVNWDYVQQRMDSYEM